MKHERQTQFGRPMTAVLPTDVSLVDKWEILQSLSEGAEDFGLNHRTLNVLRALLTFHRERFIGPEPRSAIVFPSNKTLSHRLNGMPESTLRRHLCQLVACGIVIRHDSANKKRFKRGAGVAYGFDLAPLAQNVEHITAVANIARENRNRLASLRDDLSQHRQILLDLNGMCELTEDARVILRRKPNEAVLNDICTRVKTKIASLETPEMSTPDSQNERHIQSESFNNSKPPKQNKEKKDQAHTENLSAILHQCKEYKLYFPDPVKHWNDAFSIANRLSNMMGIDTNIFQSLVMKIGKKRCVAVIFKMLDKLATINNPNGYLQRMT